MDADRALRHLGHKVEVALYAGENVAIECLDCGEVIVDANLSERIDALAEAAVVRRPGREDDALGVEGLARAILAQRKGARE